MKTTTRPLYTVTTGSTISVTTTTTKSIATMYTLSQTVENSDESPTSGLSPVVAICAGVGGGLVILVIVVVVLVILCRRAQSRQSEDIAVVYISAEGNSSSYFYI